MNFASKYAFLSNDEASGPSAAVAAAPERRGLGRALPGTGYSASSRPQQQEISTNVVACDLGSVGNNAAIATGDPVLCGCCNAVMSHLSKAVTKQGDGTYSWTCEYCGSLNSQLMLAPEELPTAMASGASAAKGTDYMLTPPVNLAAAAGAGADAADISRLIFVCDCSGSMCVSEAMAPGIARKLKGSRQGELQRLRQAGDSNSQWLPGESQGVEYVTRMQALQAAVGQQVESLAAVKPHKRVGLVSFNSDVVIYGDGSRDARALAGAKLGEFETLVAAAEGYALDKPVKEASAALCKKLYELSEEGPTALGPALLVAVSMAAQAPGSRVVVITDGLANVGLGSLEAPDFPKGTSEADKAAGTASTRAAAVAFYDRIKERAIAAGVAVDVIGFEGACCNLEALSKLVEETNGNLSRVNPANISEEFASILEEELVARQCSVTMVGHRGLHVRDPVQEAAMQQMARQQARQLMQQQVMQPISAPASSGAGAPPATLLPPMPSVSPALGRVRSHEQVIAAMSVPIAGQMKGKYGLRTGTVQLPAPDASAAAFGMVAKKCAAVVPAAAAAAEELEAAAVPAASSAAAAAPVPAACGAGAGGAAPPAPCPSASAGSALELAPGAVGYSTVTLQVGNVTVGTEVTFEYSQRRKEELGAALATAMASLTELPFQLQIAYTRKDGAECLRVITSAQPITRRRAEAESSMMASPMIAHCSRSAAAFAKGGAYKASSTVTTMYQDFVGRNVRAEDKEGNSVLGQWQVSSEAVQSSLASEISRSRAKKSAARESSYGARGGLQQGKPAPQPATLASGSGVPPRAPAVYGGLRRSGKDAPAPLAAAASAAPGVSTRQGGLLSGLSSWLGLSSEMSASSAAVEAAGPAAAAGVAEAALDAAFVVSAQASAAFALDENAAALDQKLAEHNVGLQEEEEEDDDEEEMEERVTRREADDALAANLVRMGKGSKSLRK